MTNSHYPRRLLIVPAVLAAVATAFVVIPLIALFAKMDEGSIQAAFSRDDLWTVLLRSVSASLITTVLSLTLAYLLAHSMHRTQMPGKKLLRMLLELPMLIPSVSIGMGVVLLFGNSGLLSGLLNLQRGQIYGLPGIVVGSLLYSLPVAFLMISVRKCLIYSMNIDYWYLLGWFIIGAILSMLGVRTIYKYENSYVKVM